MNLLRVVETKPLLEKVRRMTELAIDVLYKAGEDSLAKRAAEQADRIVRERRSTMLGFENMPVIDNTKTPEAS